MFRRILVAYFSAQASCCARAAERLAHLMPHTAITGKLRYAVGASIYFNFLSATSRCRTRPFRHMYIAQLPAALDSALERYRAMNIIDYEVIDYGFDEDFWRYWPPLDGTEIYGNASFFPSTFRQMVFNEIRRCAERRD